MTCSSSFCLHTVRTEVYAVKSTQDQITVGQVSSHFKYFSGCETLPVPWTTKQFLCTGRIGSQSA